MKIQALIAEPFFSQLCPGKLSTSQFKMLYSFAGIEYKQQNPKPGAKMFTCSTCGQDWPENYCPACARTIIGPKAKAPLPERPVSVPPVTPKNQVGQKISGLTECLRWFAGLFALNIALFWVPFIVVGGGHESKFLDDVVIAGIPLLCLLAISPTYKLFQISADTARDEFNYAAFVVSLIFILLPFTAPLALILLCRKTLQEASAVGYRISLLPPWMRAISLLAVTFLFGCLIIYFQYCAVRDHAQLQKSGKQTAGTLQGVTKHTIYFIPAYYSFDVQYGGTWKTFDVDKKLLQEHTLPDGTFTHHQISLIYLPDRPGVFELWETKDVSPFSLLTILIALFLMGAGGFGLYRIAANKPWKQRMK